MSIETWLLYAAAVLVLTLTPGPAVLMCVTSAVHHGARRTLFAALGSVTAVLGIMACSALGVGAVLAASERLFDLIKWCGVAYLCYIGISTLRSQTASFELPAAGQPAAPQRMAATPVFTAPVATAPGVARRRSLFAKGLLVGASNPKALLFFTAFFPQFIDPAAAQLPQFLVLGATFVCFELLSLMFYATFAARLSPWLRVPGRARAFNRMSGLTFLGAGALLATVKQAGKSA